MIFFPQQIAEFISTNAVDTVSKYNPLTAYDVADFARVGSWNYKSITELNTGNTPLFNLGIHWFDGKYPSNSYSMLDPLEDTKTVWDGNGVVEFAREDKDSIAVGNFKANLITIEYLDGEGAVLETDIYNFSTSRNLDDTFWDYIYSEFTETTYDVVFTFLRRLGETIRVTFENSGNDTYCGYFIAGTSSYMGQTLDKVNFPFTKIGRTVTNTADFDTIVEKNQLIKKEREGKRLAESEEVLLFVIDPSENSYHENMVILGKIKSCNAVGENSTKNKISWTIEKNILGA